MLPAAAATLQTTQRAAEQYCHKATFMMEQNKLTAWQQQHNTIACLGSENDRAAFAHHRMLCCRVRRSITHSQPVPVGKGVHDGAPWCQDHDHQIKPNTDLCACIVKQSISLQNTQAVSHLVNYRRFIVPNKLPMYWKAFCASPVLNINLCTACHFGACP